MQSKGFLAIVGLLIAGTIGVIIFANQGEQPAQNTQEAAQITDTDHVRGNEDSAVTLIEYADLQCPACRQYDPLVNALYQEYGDRVRFVFRHFPISRIHPNAIIAARAAEAAGRQDAFFEMVQSLYEQQPMWSDSEDPIALFENIATQLGLDLEQFKADMTSSDALDIINAQLKSAEAFNVTGTPTFILNGEKIENPQSYEEFTKLLDEKLAEVDTAAEQQP